MFKTKNKKKNPKKTGWAPLRKEAWEKTGGKVVKYFKNRISPLILNYGQCCAGKLQHLTFSVTVCSIRNLVLVAFWGVKRSGVVSHTR